MLRTGTDDAPATSATVRELADKFVTFLDTGEPPAGLFAPDVFCDYRAAVAAAGAGPDRPTRPTLGRWTSRGTAAPPGRS